MSQPFCIPSNPDVSGIGVRTAIYAQNVLAFGPVLTALWGDNTVQKDELEAVEDQSVGTLTIAFAILLSTIIQAKTSGLSNLHTAVVLDLSWMNNTCTFIWFLLYVHRRTKASDGQRVLALWKDWWKTIVSPLQSIFLPQTRKTGTDREKGEQVPRQKDLRDIKSEEKDGGLQPYYKMNSPNLAKDSKKRMTTDEAKTRTRIIWKALADNLVLVLGSFHLTLMAGIGIWLWSNPAKFGTDTNHRCDPSIAILGHDIPFSSRALQVISLLLYSILLIPGLNLVVPFFVFLVPHIIYNAYIRKPDNITKKTGTRMLNLGFIFLIAVNIVFLVDIELTLRRNRHFQESGEDEWGFGQVLALLLLVVPLRDFLNAIKNIRQRQNERTSRAQRQLEQWLPLAYQLIDRLQDESARRDVLRACGFENLIILGAKEDSAVGGVTLMHLAVLAGDMPLVKFLVDWVKGETTEASHIGMSNDAVLRTVPKCTESPLYMAVRMGYKQIVEHLIMNYKVDINAIGGEDSTPIQAAVSGGHLDIVQVLLEHGAKVDAVGGKHGTVLQAALQKEHHDILRLLLSYKTSAETCNGKTIRMKRLLEPHSYGSRISVAFSPDGKRIACGSDDGSVRIWNTETTEEEKVQRQSLAVLCVSFSPDGNSVAYGTRNNKLYIWNILTGEKKKLKHSDWVGSVAFSSDGKSVVSGCDDRLVRIWNIETGKREKKLYGHTSSEWGPVSSVAFSPDGKRVASGAWDKMVRVWNVETGEEEKRLQHLTSVTSVDFSPDGRTVASGSGYSAVRIWSVETGEIIRAMGQSAWEPAVAFSPDGKSLVSGSSDGIVHILDVETGQVIKKVGHPNPVKSVAFSPDGKKIVSASDDGMVQIWNASPMRCIAVSDNKKMVASGSDDGILRIWNVDTGKLEKRLIGRSSMLASITFSQNDKLLISKFDDGTSQVWIVETGEEEKSIDADSLLAQLDSAATADTSET